MLKEGNRRKRSTLGLEYHAEVCEAERTPAMILREQKRWEPRLAELSP
jgi:hypothetical protein